MACEDNDTITAISTPPGQGGIGIVRLSGQGSFDLVHRIFKPMAKQKEMERTGFVNNFNPCPRKLYYGYIVDETGKELDEVLVSFMPAPHTYTREDVVEINAHGGMIPLGNILRLTMRKGARLAEPGEFTKRAFLNGRIDLVQAESVLALINARTERGAYSALKGLKGFISREFEELRQELLDLRSIIAVDADFPLEDVDTSDYNELRERITLVRDKAISLQQRSTQGRILQDGLKTIIAGKPNVGKSSLYNYLLGEERAIVTDVPGTTRDLLTDYVNIKGVPLCLIDTAGLHRQGDMIERIGMDYSRRAMETADLILFMVDLSRNFDQEDLWIYENLPRAEDRSILLIGNKIDCVRKETPVTVEKYFPGNQMLEISVLTGEGLDNLKEAIVNTTFWGKPGGVETVLVMAERQAALVEEIVAHLEDAVAALAKNLPLDLVDIDLQHVYRRIRIILGESVPTDILDHIFKNFCLGK